jgi:hypothetical protein
MSDIKCVAKHCGDIPIEHWYCPKCGSEEFCIEDVDERSHEDCERLHNSDYCRCPSCNYGCTGSRFWAIYVKKNDLVKCTCCNGTGYVKSK